MIGPTLVLLICALGDGQAGDDTLLGRIEALIAPFGEKAIVEVAFRDLETGETCLIRADEPIHPASTMKVPVMLEVYRQASEGKLSLDDRIAIKTSFTSIVDGSPFTLDPKDDSELTLYKRVGEAPHHPRAGPPDDHREQQRRHQHPGREGLARLDHERS